MDWRWDTCRPEYRNNGGVCLSDRIEIAPDVLEVALGWPVFAFIALL
jgi:hypothetical protein